MNKEDKLTFQDLADWLDRPLSNTDIDFINFILTSIENRYKHLELQQKVNQLESELSKSKCKIYETIEFLKTYIKDLSITPLGHRTYRQYITPCIGALEILERDGSNE